MKRDALLGCWLFQPMRPEEIDEIVSCSAERRILRRTRVFDQGDEGTSLMAVLVGVVGIGTIGIGGKEISHRRVRPGEIFGEIALLDGKPRTANAVALEDTILMVVERKVFMPVLLRHEGLIERMLIMLCERLRRTTIALEEVALYDLPERLARVFRRMCEESGQIQPDGAIRIDQRMSDTEWASILGAPTRETVNRLIKSWAKSGLLVRAGGYVTIADPQRLQLLAEPASVGS